MSGPPAAGGTAGADAIEITVNGAARRVAAGTTIAALVRELADASSRGLAVAVDREVVPRSRWDEVVVAPGASVEVVTAAAGG